MASTKRESINGSCIVAYRSPRAKPPEGENFLAVRRLTTEYLFCGCFTAREAMLARS